MNPSPEQNTPIDSRRCLLKTAGLSLTLPALESFSPDVCASEQATNTSDTSLHSDAKAKRLICIGSNLGLYRQSLYPSQSGRNYQTTPLLKPLADHRDEYTLFSGFDHRAANGHANWDNFLCGNRVGAVSLDQIAAEQIGKNNRFGSLQLCAGDIPKQRMVFSKHGVPLPMINRPSVVFSKMFASSDDRARTEYLLRSGRSTLDQLRQDAKSLKQKVSTSDQQKLEEYFSSLRELERRMGRQLNHLTEDAPKVDYELPPYDPIAPTMMLECEQIMFDLMALALQTNSTRVATLFIAGLGQVFTLDGQTMRAGYHALSHHGNDPDLIRDLVRVETEHMKCLSRFIKQLKEKTDVDGRPLLDTTVVMFGTGMGDASRHSNRDLPTIVSGGGFQHGQHIATDPQGSDSRLLGDVFISVLEQLGIPAPSFSNAKQGIDDWA
ncbi:DUF1552 domain-containing protein [Stieleria marina]|uniref:Sulfatase n=1 Tax=Stieleria marina TaxID=1930275 RepID=A0A517NT94_9BACT|nr:hypothetical protein K239x_23000 [Planctomycetes bacterium K23_9]